MKRIYFQISKCYKIYKLVDVEKRLHDFARARDINLRFLQATYHICKSELHNKFEY